MSTETLAPEYSQRLQHRQAPAGVGGDDIARLASLSAGGIDVRLELGGSEPRFTLSVAVRQLRTMVGRSR